jgi:adenosylmethionine-8-amino-7-oxononanoate aminotransferase
MTPSILLKSVQASDEQLTTVKVMTSASPIPDQMAENTDPALMHRSLLECPHIVTSAAGNFLTLSDGRKILDGCGGAAVAIIGHNNQEVIAATAAQMQKVSYVHTMSYTTDSAEDLAKCILDCPAGSFQHGLEKAIFVGSGSEANDAAMKLARQYFFEQGQGERRFYVSRRQGYHGNTIATMSISTILARKVPYDGGITLPNVSYVSPAYAYQYQARDETVPQYVERLLSEIDAEFLRLGPQNVIAFFAEPVVGAASGCVAAPEGYFPGVRELCDKYGILLILDEIMCGMGRTGTYFAFEQENIVPDIVTVGKGLGGGYLPIAAVLVSKRVVDVLRKGSAAFNNGQTYQSHPVTCAAALAVQDIIKRENLVERCAKMGEKLERLLREAFRGSKYVGDIRGRGLFWALEFVNDTQSKEPFDASIGFGAQVQLRTFENGVAIYPGFATVDGIRGDHVLIAPPYTVSDEELETIVNAVKKAYDAQEALVDNL